MACKIGDDRICPVTIPLSYHIAESIFHLDETVEETLERFDACIIMAPESSEVVWCIHFHSEEGYSAFALTYL